MHVYTRDKAALRQSVMQPGERKSVWVLVQAAQRSNSQSRQAMMPDPIMRASRNTENLRFHARAIAAARNSGAWRFQSFCLATPAPLVAG